MINTGVLGIPFLDVVRVLAAVLLLGNLQFHETNGGGGQCETHEAELKAVAGLLGVTPASLLRGLTMRTHNVRGQLVKSICDANMVKRTFLYLLFFSSFFDCKLYGGHLYAHTNSREEPETRWPKPFIVGRWRPLCGEPIASSVSACRARSAPIPTIRYTTRPRWQVNTHRPSARPDLNPADPWPFSIRQSDTLPTDS